MAHGGSGGWGGFLFTPSPRMALTCQSLVKNQNILFWQGTPFPFPSPATSGYHHSGNAMVCSCYEASRGFTTQLAKGVSRYGNNIF